MSARRDPADKDASHEQDGLVADGKTSNDVARLLEALHLPVGRVPIAAEGHDGREGPAAPTASRRFFFY